jgi:hypothetical protein
MKNLPTQQTKETQLTPKLPDMHFRLMAFAMATPDDAGFTAVKRSVNGSVRTEYAGTVYGWEIGTARYGRYFQTPEHALGNALSFIEECEHAAKKRGMDHTTSFWTWFPLLAAPRNF